MAKIIWLDPATFDLEEIAEYIALDDPDAASRVVARILRHVRQLTRHPKSGSAPPELEGSQYRQIVEPPCRIFYRIERGTVFIVHVMRSERILRLSRLEESE